ncbi:MAG: outer membrane lipoprotein-sorting protein [Oceanicoccus sp.]|jgi:outer membrane lipoprotein-sorting protein
MTKRMTLFLLLVLVPLSQSIADDGRAKELIQKMDDMYRSTASRATMTMRMQTPDYDRSMTMESVTIGEEKMLIRILSPRKERGIATLKIDKEMWNFFPKINKTIKVPPSMMMGSWMGSDFTNDDLVKESSLVEEYALSLREDADVYEITLTPKAQTVTVWGKIVVKINKIDNTPAEQAFFDDKGRKVRIMTYKEPKKFGSVTLPSVLEMIPLNKTGHKTLIIYDNLELNAQGVEEQLFTLRSLKQRLR